MAGLRQIVISNGSLSRRLIAARAVEPMRRLPATLERLNSGPPDPWNFIWASGLEVPRIALTSEAPIAARPAHGGACVVVDRPAC